MNLVSSEIYQLKTVRGVFIVARPFTVDQIKNFVLTTAEMHIIMNVTAYAKVILSMLLTEYWKTIDQYCKT
jgi:hypothetical protein